VTTFERLRELAQAATPGPWYHHNPDDALYMNAFYISESPVEHEPEEEEFHKACIALTLYQIGRIGGNRLVTHPQYAENTAYIAAADPSTILALLAELDRLRSGLERQRGLWELVAPVLNALDDRAFRVRFMEFHQVLEDIDAALGEEGREA
jgi:hypothetical protein